MGLKWLQNQSARGHQLTREGIMKKMSVPGTIPRSQVVKQSYVVALVALLPEAFPGATAETNFRHYRWQKLLK
jgi:trehalose/maltose hydrolase-like predicted phosphorylase